MRVEKQEFVWEFTQLSCPGQTRTRVAWELMKVDKREFVWEFSQLSCPGQTRSRVARESMRVEKREFVNSRVLDKREDVYRVKLSLTGLSTLINFHHWQCWASFPQIYSWKRSLFLQKVHQSERRVNKFTKWIYQVNKKTWIYCSVKNETYSENHHLVIIIGVCCVLYLIKLSGF